MEKTIFRWLLKKSIFISLIISILFLLTFFSCDELNLLANAGDDLEVYLGSVVYLDGSASLFRSTSQWKWSFTQIPENSLSELKDNESGSPNFSPDKIGLYEVELIIVEKGQSSAPDRISIKVSDPPVELITVSISVSALNGSQGWVHVSPPGINLFPGEVYELKYLPGTRLTLTPRVKEPEPCAYCPYSVFSGFQGDSLKGNSLLIDEEKNITALFDIFVPVIPPPTQTPVAGLPGRIEQWIPGPDFQTGRNEHSSVITGDYLYILGGDHAIGGGSGNREQSVSKAFIYPDGTLSAWEAERDLPLKLSGHSSIATDSHIYVMGGSFKEAESKVYFSQVNPTDGSLGIWEETTALPEVLTGQGSVFFNNRIYVIGGENSILRNSVYYSSINPDGTLGNWLSTSSIPQALTDMGTALFEGKIYVSGGRKNNGMASGNVYYAPINSDGTLGNWQSTTLMNTPRYNHGMAFQNGYLYVAGGENASVLDSVEFAKIEEDGSIGLYSWNSALSFDAPSTGLSMVCRENVLYLTGGRLNDIYFSRTLMGTLEGSSSIAARSFP